MISDGTFHRWDGEYLTRRDWPDAPSVRERVRRALGPEPLPNARHMLAPVTLPAPVDARDTTTTAFENLSDSAQLDLRLRLARSVEMRLMAAGRRFPARDVWRGVYALGLRWGDMDVFHWRNPAKSSGAAPNGKALFTISASGDPAYFLPERAEEGEAVPGLIFSFELPTCPAPLLVYDRMAIALSYLRQQLGGRPTAADGAELDHDRLYEDRDALAGIVREMNALGIAPGSAEAARLL